MTLEKIMQYEAATTGLVMSEFYALFPKLFVRKCQRKLKRYELFKKLEKEMYDRTPEYLNKYFTKK